MLARLVLRPHHLLLAQLDAAVHVLDETLLQWTVDKHGAQCRGEAYGELERTGLRVQGFKHSQKRNIAFAQRLEQPVLLEELGIFKVSDIW